MLLWKEDSPEGIPYKVWGFNPCSLGCCSERGGVISITGTVNSFNPCSLGCCSESRLFCYSIALSIKFQSLFSWMLLWKNTDRWLSYTWQESFNPCSLGCCSERWVVNQNSRHWRSFNPCSLGCCSESFFEIPSIRRQIQFQSLFSWMLLWKPIIFTTIVRLQPVSILVLLDVALKARVFLQIFLRIQREKTPSVYFLCLIPNYSFPHKWKKLD